MFKGPVEIGFSSRKHAVPIDDDPGMFSHCLGNGVAEPMKPRSHFTGYDRDTAYEPFMRAFQMAYSAALAVFNITIHG